MKWIDRLLLVLRAAIQDMFSEDGPQGPPDFQVGGLERSFDELQSRLDGLGMELAEATLREKRAELEWRQALKEDEVLDAAVNNALGSGQEELARLQLQQLRQKQAGTALLSEHYLDCVRVSAQLHEQISGLQARLAEVRRRAAALAERERSAQALEGLSQLQRELRKDVAALQESLVAREEQVARREDRLAAQEDLKREA